MVVIKKIAFVTIAFVMLMGTGTIFASFNSGENLTSWYDQSFQKKSDQIASDSSEKVTTSFNELSLFLNEKIDEIKDEIGITRTNATIESKNETKELQKRYLEDLDQTAIELKNSDYQVGFENEKQKQVSEVEEDVEGILNEILSK